MVLYKGYFKLKLENITKSILIEEIYLKRIDSVWSLVAKNGLNYYLIQDYNYSTYQEAKCALGYFRTQSPRRREKWCWIATGGEYIDTWTGEKNKMFYSGIYQVAGFTKKGDFT